MLKLEGLNEKMNSYSLNPQACHGVGVDQLAVAKGVLPVDPLFDEAKPLVEPDRRQIVGIDGQL